MISNYFEERQVICAEQNSTNFNVTSSSSITIDQPAQSIEWRTQQIMNMNKMRKMHNSHRKSNRQTEN